MLQTLNSGGDFSRNRSKADWDWDKGGKGNKGGCGKHDHFPQGQQKGGKGDGKHDGGKGKGGNFGCKGGFDAGKGCHDGKGNFGCFDGKGKGCFDGCKGSDGKGGMFKGGPPGMPPGDFMGKANGKGMPPGAMMGPGGCMMGPGPQGPGGPPPGCMMGPGPVGPPPGCMMGHPGPMQAPKGPGPPPGCMMGPGPGVPGGCMMGPGGPMPGPGGCPRGPGGPGMLPPPPPGSLPPPPGSMGGPMGPPGMCRGPPGMMPAPRMPGQMMPGPPGSMPPPPGPLGGMGPPGMCRGPPGGMMPAPPGTLALAPPPPQGVPAAFRAPDVPQFGAPPSFDGALASHIPEKKPQLFMLIAQMAPQITEPQMQQLLEQCGEVQAFRRGKDGAGNPLSFGVAQFSDAEAAWKASNCLMKRSISGQEIKIMLEENTENLITKWKTAQKLILRVSNDDELEWELERKAVSCKALIDAKLEELYGPSEVAAAGGGAALQRRQELRERERTRVDRAKKRKAWRESEFTRELSHLEASEKSLRGKERERDNVDRLREENELKEKQARELKLEKLEADGGATNVNVSQLADNRTLMELVDKVQEEPREGLFTVRIDPSYLRNERILERKLRPWLEKRVDLYMGGQMSDLVEHIIRRVNGTSLPDPLVAELERFLDDHAEPLVERLWRMLVLELTQDGLELPSVKRAKKEEVKDEKL